MSGTALVWEVGSALQALYYDGSFELGWLREDERVAAAFPSEPGACEILYGDGLSCVVPLDHWVVRTNPDPSDDRQVRFTVVPSDTFRSKYEEVPD